MQENLEKKLGKKWQIFNELHKFILSINPKIKYRLFTIYVIYLLEDNLVAIVYFHGKSVKNNQLDVGLSLKEKPKISGFVNAGYMKYQEINYSMKINSKKDIAKIKKIKSLIINNN